MKINIIRDENGKIITIDASSESSDGHLTKEEHDLIREIIAEDSKTEQKKIEESSKTEQKKIEEESKVRQVKHKEWADTTGTIIKGFCEAVVDYLEEKEIRDATKPKEPKFDKSVDHLDLTGPKDEESKPQIEEKPSKPRPDLDAYYAQNGNKFS